jgi:hypothetical protein
VVKNTEGLTTEDRMDNGRELPGDYNKNGNKKPPGGGFLFRLVAAVGRDAFRLSAGEP